MSDVSLPAVGAAPVRAGLLVAGGAFLIGLAPIGMRLSELGPMATAFWRFAFALPILVALAAREPAPPAGPPRRALWIAVAGACFGMDIVLWHAALTLTTVANATLLSNLTPVVAAGVGWFVFKERFGRGFFAAAGVALVGAGLLAFGRSLGGQGPASGAQGALGDALGLFSALWYAAYLILLREARRTVRVWRAMAITTLAALGVALAASLALGESLWPQTLQGWLVLAALGVVAHVGGQGLIAMGIGALPITLSSVLLWVQPVAAAAFSWALFGEALGPVSLAGAALVLAGLYGVQRARG